MNISNYYQQTFRTELASFLGQSSRPYFGHSWRYDCRSLELVPVASRPFFLVCLYFTVLFDQAMHARHWDRYSRFEEFTRYPKFCHRLGQFQHNPRAILSVPIDHDLVSADEVHAQLAPGMELFVAEVISFFRSHMPDLSLGRFLSCLLDDRVMQTPRLFVGVYRAGAEPTDYRAHSALQQAIKNAALKVMQPLFDLGEFLAHSLKPSEIQGICLCGAGVIVPRARDRDRMGAALLSYVFLDQLIGKHFRRAHREFKGLCPGPALHNCGGGKGLDSPKYLLDISHMRNENANWTRITQLMAESCSGTEMWPSGNYGVERKQFWDLVRLEIERNFQQPHREILMSVVPADAP